MNKLTIFNNDNFGEIRTVEDGEKVLFCAADIARALGYSNSRKAISDHCRGVTKRDTPTNSGIQSVNFIPESDVYRLITHSKLPAAEKFERWVLCGAPHKTQYADKKIMLSYSQKM